MNEAVLLQLQSEAKERSLAQIADLQEKLEMARKRLERGDIAKTLRFAGDAGELDGAVAEHYTLSKLIQMEARRG